MAGQFRGAAVLAAVLAAHPAAAGAAWLHCGVTGSSGAGEFVYLTTLANVGKAPAARLKQFEERAAAYVSKADAEATAVRAACFAPEDQLEAAEHYSRLLNTSAARVGWDHVMVVRPREWLAEGDVLDDPSMP